MEMDEFRNSDKYLRAKKKLDAMKGFYWHLFTSLFIIPFLAIINYLTTDFPWVVFPTAGILLSLIIHWFAVFRGGSIFGKNWEERKLQEFIEEENEQRKMYK